MSRWVSWLAAMAFGASGSAQASTNVMDQAANVITVAKPSAPAGDCSAALIGTWTWSGVNRLLERQGMAAVEMETRMELRADGQFVQRQRSRAKGEKWTEGEGRGTWSAGQASGSSDPSECTLTMERNRVNVMLNGRGAFSLPSLGITYRRAPD